MKLSHNGNLQAARGQARIPDAASMFRLIHAASREGWFVKIEDQTLNNEG